MPPCAGRVEKAHLISKQVLKRMCPEFTGSDVERKAKRAAFVWDERAWVCACATHHFYFDNYRGLIVPREALPGPLEALCAEIGLEHWLTRRYGEREAA